jgi:hypothetical protein
MKRAALLAVLGVILLWIGTGCAPPPQIGAPVEQCAEGLTRQGPRCLTPVELFESWVDTHVTVVQLSGPGTGEISSGYFPKAHTLYINAAGYAARGWSADAVNFMTRHEEGHVVGVALGLHFVPDDGVTLSPVAPGLPPRWPGEEEKAQLVACVVTGDLHSPLYGPAFLPSDGYIDCDPALVALTRAALIAGGLWA